MERLIMKSQHLQIIRGRCWGVSKSQLECRLSMLWSDSIMTEVGQDTGQSLFLLIIMQIQQAQLETLRQIFKGQSPGIILRANATIHHIQQQKRHIT